MATSARTFNRNLRRGLRAAEEHYPRLEAAYLACARRALRGAQRAVQAMSVEITHHAPHEMVAAGRFPDQDELFPRGKLEKDVEHKTKKPRELAAKAVVKNAAPGISWEVGGIFSERLLAMAGVRAGMLDVMAREVVAGLIGQALQEGWTVPETAAAIGGAVETATPAIATMLARTDLVGTSNGASVEAARLVYPDQQLMKTWLATDDERTRETHVEADGQTVPLDQSFQVGDDLLDYPGDPDGSDEEVCNCRCTVIYEPMPAAEATASVASHDLGIIRDSRVNDRYDWRAYMSATETEPVMPAVASGDAWTATLAVEDTWTEDGRKLVGGTTRWRDLPLTLSAMIETTEGGHLGAEIAGRIDTIDRVGQNIVAAGVFDAGEYGQEIKRLVRERTLRGVSVDLAVLDYEIRDIETDAVLTEDQAVEAFFEGKPVGLAVLDSVIGMATICPFQAIEGATIETVASAAQPVLRLTMTFDPFHDDEITAAAAGLVPLDPPSDWFDKKEGSEATPFTVTSKGQVYGNLALWGECHIGIDHACIMPKPSPSGYAHYHLGCTVTAEGDKVATGVLTMDTGHAPLGVGLTPKQVVAHYDNTGLAIADVTVHDGVFGPWVAGALRPDVPATKVRALRAARMSGDWRKYPGGADLSAILMVNVGGYEVPRTQASLVASAATGYEVVELVAAAIVTPEAEIEQLADDVLHGEIERLAATV